MPPRPVSRATLFVDWANASAQGFSMMSPGWHCGRIISFSESGGIQHGYAFPEGCITTGCVYGFISRHSGSTILVLGESSAQVVGDWQISLSGTFRRRPVWAWRPALAANADM